MFKTISRAKYTLSTSSKLCSLNYSFSLWHLIKHLMCIIPYILTPSIFYFVFWSSHTFLIHSWFFLIHIAEIHFYNPEVNISIITQDEGSILRWYFLCWIFLHIYIHSFFNYLDFKHKYHLLKNCSFICVLQNAENIIGVSPKWILSFTYK
jgi:hypothetical protein